MSLAFDRVGEPDREATRARTSGPRLILAGTVSVALAACTGPSGLPCEPASHYAAEAGAPYRAVEARVPAPEGYVLVGTLTLPKPAAGPAPAVVLISGSHAQTRDMVGGTEEPLVRYRPFRQLAETLSRRGIAVLRLDDRGTGCSGGGRLSEASTATRADDTRAALTFLRGRREVDRRRLGLLGISEGATIAVMIAAADGALRAVVSMAGTAGPGWQVWAHQTRYLISLGQEMDPAKKARWRAGEDPERILEERVAEARAHVAAGEANAWWTFFFDFDPSIPAREVSAPVLILHGDRDSNVPVAHAHKLAQAIRSGGNSDVTVKIHPDHNHLFLPDKHGGFRRYGQLLAQTNQVPAPILEQIADWLAQRLAVEEEGG
ncbi:MAG: alpha/beta hydrolase [Alphaproteobacteria bacterium]|nr:alpha/beta hydrolase [Alphaproteobacteria bacterium]MDP6813406.1 alpha/beta hydrolase [Alphaproteobacteria bacterium]